MEVNERSVIIPVTNESELFTYLRASLRFHLETSEVPVRFAITSSDERHYFCEIGVVRSTSEVTIPDVFEFRRRNTENTEEFNVALAVPTGIGAAIGGHAGDATAVARVLSKVSDRLILHPNVVNASDINEMPDNSLYVEGSVLTRLLMGTVGLQPSRSNRLLVVLEQHPDQHFIDAAINTVSAARATYGLNCAEVILLNPSVHMRTGYTESGRAAGRVSNLQHCLNVLTDKRSEYDAIAFSSIIRVPQEYHSDYFKSDGEMVNPWGGVEAMLTHTMSSLLNVPTAHSPMFESRRVENIETGIVEPRMSAEAVSVAFLQCVLKGLHRSPRIVTDLQALSRPEIFSAEDVSCLVIPDGCLGLPTIAALYQGIPVIAVRGNNNLMQNDLSKLPWKSEQLLYVDNYLEAAGVIAALRAGVSLDAVRRPITRTNVGSYALADSDAESANGTGR